MHLVLDEVPGRRGLLNLKREYRMTRNRMKGILTVSMQSWV